MWEKQFASRSKGGGQRAEGRGWLPSFSALDPALKYLRAKTSFTGSLLLPRFRSLKPHGQAHIPSPQQAARSHARIPRPHVHQVGAPDSQPPPEKGAEAADRSDPEQVRRRLTGVPDGPSGEKPSGFGFPRSRRLTRGAELQGVAREGKRIRTMHLDVRATASPLGHPRVGVVVPRYSGSAVDRNRLKRRLRELVRTRLLPTAPSVDVVIRARREAYAASFDALSADVARAAAQVTRLFGPSR